MQRVAVVVVGGDPPNDAVPEHLPAHHLTIAADSGYDHARRLGLDVDVLVGDLDSISAAGLADAEARGIAVECHRPDKDQTDTELAIACAVARGVARIVGVSGGGDRPDHAWSTLLAFAAYGSGGPRCDRVVGAGAGVGRAWRHAEGARR